MNSVLLPSRSLSLRRLTFRPFRPQPPCCHLPITAFARYLSRMGRRVYPPGRSGRIGGNAVTRSEVRHWLAGSPTGLAESGSLSYGLVIHLRLLPTPPRGDAVTFGYRFVTQTWWGLAPHRSNVFRDALAQAFTPAEHETIVDISFSLKPPSGGVNWFVGENWLRINHLRPLKGAGKRKMVFWLPFPRRKRLG